MSCEADEGATEIASLVFAVTSGDRDPRSKSPIAAPICDCFVDLSGPECKAPQARAEAQASAIKGC